MTTLLEMTASIVTAHAHSTPMTKDELISELQKVHAALLALERVGPVEPTEVPSAPDLTPLIEPVLG